jgi:hypothetical protein
LYEEKVLQKWNLFGQAKTAYGLDNIKAHLKETSKSWIACIFMVHNLVKLAGQLHLCLKIVKNKLEFFSTAIKISLLKLK